MKHGVKTAGKSGVLVLYFFFGARFSYATLALRDI